MISFRKSNALLIMVLFSIGTVTLFLGMPTAASDGYSYIWTKLRTDGNVSISFLTISYGVDQVVQANYFIEFVMSGDDPLVHINLDWYGNKTVAILNKATLTVFSSLFSWQNGSSERFTFWDDLYYSSFFPDAVKNENDVFTCSYAFNLSSQVSEAEAKFANNVHLANTSQSYLGARISFSIIVDTLRIQGQERHLEFLFQKENVNPLTDCSFLLQTSVSIPSDAEFINLATLDNVEMTKILKTVEGVIQVPYSDLSSHRTTAEWKVANYPPWWQNPPQSWLLSSLLGALIISPPFSFVFSYMWHRYQRPKLSMNQVEKSAKEPAIHPVNHMALYHLTALNEGRTTAFDSEILLTFKDDAGKELFSLKGKWDRAPEPLGPLQPNFFSQVWPALIPFGEQTNVRPNLPEAFCIVVKDNEDYCYAFGGESYLHNYKKPEWRLPLGDFILEVEIRSGNSRRLSRFMLKNKGNTTQDIEVTEFE